MATSALTDAQVRRIVGPPTNAYDSHRPVLAEAIIRTQGPILELGMGAGSTPALDEIARLDHRIVESYEDNPTWYARMAPRQTDLPVRINEPPHFYYLVMDWDELDVGRYHWGLAFVDHGQLERRAREVGRLADQADVVVVHDTEDVRYRYWTIFGLFKYRLDYMAIRPWTTVFSNFTDVSEWTIT